MPRATGGSGASDAPDPYGRPRAGAPGTPSGPAGIPGIGASCTGGWYAAAPTPVGVSAVPQLRQNFIPGGFSPRHTTQTTLLGNPDCAGGVFARELPQFRQNDD